MKKKLYDRRYTSPTKWGTPTESFLEIYFNFTFEKGFWFTVRVPDVKVERKNLFRAMSTVLEHESIGMAKYRSLKRLIYDNHLDQMVFENRAIKEGK